MALSSCKPKHTSQTSSKKILKKKEEEE